MREDAETNFAAAVGNVRIPPGEIRLQANIVQLLQVLKRIEMSMMRNT